MKYIILHFGKQQNTETLNSMGIKTLKVYIENSVIGGYFDDEFKVVEND
jgi:hypothetical protein